MSEDQQAEAASATQSDSAPPERPFGEHDAGQLLVTGLSKIGLATRHRAWAEAEGQGLTPTQGQILTLLRLSPRTGMRVTALADDLAVTAATATVAIQALERKGLVRKARASDDGRARAISLTAAGLREAERAAGWADFLLEAVDELTPAEQEVFHRGLVKMIRALQVRGEIPVSRMCITCRFFQPHVHADPGAPHHCAFVDAPFGDGHVRLECADHERAPAEQAERAWQQFLASGQPDAAGAAPPG